MPFYTFRDTRTDEVFEVEMTYEEYVEFDKKKDAHIEREFVMRLGDAVKVGVTKPDPAFMKYVLGKVKQVPGSRYIEKTKHIPKEV